MHRRANSTATKALFEQIVGSLVSIDKRKALNEGIAAFYDESSSVWEKVWGQHMHHGYYAKGRPQKTNTEAQVDMIEEILDWAGVKRVRQRVYSGISMFLHMVDVGCGIGGSSRYIAQKYGAKATGITLSSKQAQRATELSQQQGLQGQCSFQVADALHQPFDQESFDLVWSLESGEHMPDKRKFVGELARVCSPRGRVIVVTWCHRNLEQNECRLRGSELTLLERICNAYYLPAWCSLDDYKQLFQEHGLQDISTADWSEEVAPFWGAVIQSALTGNGLRGLLSAGWTTIKGALVMPLMAQGYRMGTIKFVLITGTKSGS